MAVLSKKSPLAEVEADVRAYEARLRAEMGLRSRVAAHFRRPEERPFTASQRPHTTILFGGLTLAHEEIVRIAMDRLGYRLEPLPCPDNESLAVGKEFGNRGMCNPTYYTVGNLVKHLNRLRAAGETGIEDRYVFLTAGGCGPCRFGMYEAEYRKALADSGFSRFRVILFQQNEGLSQTGEEAGLVLNKEFFVLLIRAIIAGDLLNDLGYKIRPYETNAGDTDRALAEGKRLAGEALRDGRPLRHALREAGAIFSRIRVDYTRVKPRVAIIGEFWAMTTEGDGSYRLHRWLESEGAEAVVQPVSAWIDYMIFEGLTKIGLRRGLPGSLGLRTVLLLHYAKALFHWHYFVYRRALGGKPSPLPSQRKLAAYARPYYDPRLSGGEGHLEVAKHIAAVKHKKAHMVVSVKPFGCMPSTQSDGVQTKVISDYPDSIFIPIETSGDAEVNVRSRIQMKLFEARQKAREEFDRVLSRAGISREEAAAYASAHPDRFGAMVPRPHADCAGTAASFVKANAKAFHRERSVRRAFRRVQDKAHEEEIIIKEKIGHAREEAAGLAERIAPQQDTLARDEKP